MKILAADYIYIQGEYMQNYAVLFKDTIIDIDTVARLAKKYPNVYIEYLNPNSIIYPGFINTHVHLEFTSNSTHLSYGDFVSWLESVIKYREEIMKKCTTETMQKACNEMLQSGITTFGAISSNAIDMDVCSKTPQRVLFFNEIIGSNENFNDFAYDNFINRYKSSLNLASDIFIPSIAIHSPYSVNKALAQKVVSFAKNNNLLLTAHLLESKEEREWLENGTGRLGEFLKSNFNATKPVNEINDFIEIFNGVKTHFVHCVNTNSAELELLAQKGHSIAHCPRSNRILGCGTFDFKQTKCKISLATDGLSSNWSLNIFDELRAALMMHENQDLKQISEKLLRSITIDAAEILNLNCGIIAPKMSADFAIIELKDSIKSIDAIAYLTILQTKNASRVYIKGERYV